MLLPGFEPGFWPFSTALIKSGRIVKSACLRADRDFNLDDSNLSNPRGPCP